MGPLTDSRASTGPHGHLYSSATRPTFIGRCVNYRLRKWRSLLHMRQTGCLKHPGSTEQTVTVSTQPGDGNLYSCWVSETPLPCARAGSGLGCHLRRHFSHSRAAARGMLSRWGLSALGQLAEPCKELPASLSSLLGSKGPSPSFLSLPCSGTDPHLYAPQVSYSSTNLSSTEHKLKPLASPFWRTCRKKSSFQ